MAAAASLPPSSAASATAAATPATTEAHAPLSLDDGHHHLRSSHQAQNQNQKQDHAMGMVIVPRARRARCCVEVEGFEMERVGTELARAMEESGSSSSK